MYKRHQFIAVVLAGLAVILGAFGAHALKAVLPLDKLTVFETGVRYQFLHAIALLVLSYAMENTIKQNENAASLIWLKRTANLFIMGVVLFSGSLYLLAMQPLYNLPLSSFIGPITPIGGAFFIAAWFSWALAIMRR